ncbi:MAG: GYD domain-containing protein [Acidobacteria bacterium]|nr:MAG: GYD domain-containing protein [Acidobacteriota bacterium]
MAHFLFQVAYTAEAWATLLKNPHDRIEIVRPVLQKLGGDIESAYMAFGEYDIVGVMNLPSNVEAAAFSLAATAGGSIKAIKTTPLMTVQEGVSAMQKAAAAGYVPPAAPAGV